jgi:hypothetical protein
MTPPEVFVRARRCQGVLEQAPELWPMRRPRCSLTPRRGRLAEVAGDYARPRDPRRRDADFGQRIASADAAGVHAAGFAAAMDRRGVRNTSTGLMPWITAS